MNGLAAELNDLDIKNERKQLEQDRQALELERCAFEAERQAFELTKKKENQGFDRKLDQLQSTMLNNQRENKQNFASTKAILHVMQERIHRLDDEKMNYSEVIRNNSSKYDSGKFLIFVIFTISLIKCFKTKSD